MYFTEIDNQSYAIKPMNCPAYMFIDRLKLNSFRDLPINLFELVQSKGMIRAAICTA
jgi:threonyl-tRNA synthetase